MIKNIFAGSAWARIRSARWSKWSGAQKRFLAIELAVIGVALPLSGLAVARFSDQFWIGHDASEASCLPWSWMLVERAEAGVQPIVTRGMLVAIKARGMGPYVPDGTPLGKIVTAIPGDVVTISDAGIMITEPNGKAHNVGAIDQQAIARGDVKKGIPAGLPSRDARLFFGKWQLAHDEVFLLGSAPLSQDSRYFGPRKISDIKGVIRYAI